MTMLSVILLWMVIISADRPLGMAGSHNTMKRSETALIDVATLLGSTRVDTTMDGLRIRLWVITQRRHREIMRERSGSISLGMGPVTDPNVPVPALDPTKVNTVMKPSTKKLMMAGTHHVLLNVADSVSGSEVVNTSATLLVRSPGGKRSLLELRRMMGHFGIGVSMAERGTYQLTIDVNANGISHVDAFTFTVE